MSNKELLPQIGDALERKWRDLQWEVKGRVRKVKYLTRIPKSERRQAETKCEEFNREFLAFLSENPSDILSPLNPTCSQMVVINFLLQSVREGRSMKVENSGSLFDGDPLHEISFEVAIEDPDFPGNTAISSDLSTFWDVTKQFPRRSFLIGHLYALMRRRLCIREEIHPPWIHFLYSPQKIMTTKEAVQSSPKLFGNSQKDNSTTRVEVFEDGECITRTTVSDRKGKRTTKVERYILLGSFNGQETENTYWVYGFNENNLQKKKQPIRTPAQEMRPRLVAVHL